MKRLILIDGENLIHGLRKLGGENDSKLPREKLLGFSFRKIINEVLEDEEKAQIFFYGARLKQFHQDKKLLRKTQEIIKWQSYLVNDLQKQGIQFVKVGNLRARETSPCPKCKHNEWHLIEKGVDVGLAVAMVTGASKDTEIVLVSSDTDLIPAVKEAKKKSKIIYIGYENSLVVSMIRNTHLTRIITKPMVERHLKEAGK